MRPLVSLAAFGLLMCGAVASATTFHVDVNGGGDYVTIQEGMTAAAGGDTVLVAPGTYLLTEYIDYGGKAVVLMSEAGPATTIIDGQSQASAVKWRSEGPGTKFIGFTVRHGSSGYGGALGCEDGSSPMISNCVITDCSAENGGGIYVYQSSPEVTDCVITNCDASNSGGGIYCYSSSGAKFLRNVIGRNTAEEGGGIQVWYGGPEITNCTFYRNASQGGGAIQCAGSHPTITRCIAAFSTEGKGIGCTYSANPTIVQCDVYGNAGGDDLCAGGGTYISDDPLFCSMDDHGDVSLCSNSPCLETPLHNPWLVLIGATGQGCSACSTPSIRLTWGGVKGLYR